MLLITSQFKSGFLKPDYENIEIVFNHRNNKTFKFYKIASSLTGRKEEGDKNGGKEEEEKDKEHKKNTCFLYCKRVGNKQIEWDSESLLMNMFKIFI